MIMGKRQWWAVLYTLILVASIPARARTHLQGYVERGGQSTVSTLSGQTVTTQRSYPGATVTVYLTGTSTLASIYRTATAGSPISGSQVTANANAYWDFYVGDGTYDIRFSGGTAPNTITSPFTFTAVSVGTSGVEVNILSTGAVCDGVTLDTLAIQSAIDLTTAANNVVVPTDTCATGPLFITKNWTTIRGSGLRASTLQFVPSANGQAAIRAKLATSTIISGTTIRDLAILTADTTYAKIGIEIYDGSQTTIDHVQIGVSGGWIGGTSIAPFTGTGSIGLKLEGREFGTITNVGLFAAIPLYIAQNPNNTGIDIDHHRFSDFYFIANGDNPNVLIADDVQATNVTFEHGAWVGGSYGLYWNDTTSVGTSSQFMVSDVRYEQPTAAGYILWITKNALLRQLTVNNLLGGTGTTINGIYLRNVSPVAISDYTYNGTLRCLDVDTPILLEWRSSVCQSASSKSLGNTEEVWSVGFADSSSPMPVSGYWETPFSNHTAGLIYRLGSVYHRPFTGSLASGSTVAVPTNSGSIIAGSLVCSFHGATKDGILGAAITPTNAFLGFTSDATIMAVGNVASKFCVHWSSASSVVLRNNLAETVTYTCDYTWN